MPRAASAGTGRAVLDGRVAAKGCGNICSPPGSGKHRCCAAAPRRAGTRRGSRRRRSTRRSSSTSAESRYVRTQATASNAAPGKACCSVRYRSAIARTSVTPSRQRDARNSGVAPVPTAARRFSTTSPRTCRSAARRSSLVWRLWLAGGKRRRSYASAWSDCSPMLRGPTSTRAWSTRRRSGT